MQFPDLCTGRAVLEGVYPLETSIQYIAFSIIMRMLLELRSDTLTMGRVRTGANLISQKISLFSTISENG